MQEAVSILQRARELALQGAHGTYTQSDTQAMAAEVNQLAEPARRGGQREGRRRRDALSGDRTQSRRFARSKGGSTASTSRSSCRCSTSARSTRTRPRSPTAATCRSTSPGNQGLLGGESADLLERRRDGYVVQQDSTINVDGHEVRLREGDGISAIIAKINESGRTRSCKARPGPELAGRRTTTAPHQLWLDDGEGGQVLADLGILNGRGNAPPQNTASSARVFGGSMFDMLINLRDQLAAGDTIDTGGRALGGIDSALDNVLGRLGTLGSYDERLCARLRAHRKRDPGDYRALLERGGRRHDRGASPSCECSSTRTGPRSAPPARHPAHVARLSEVGNENRVEGFGPIEISERQVITFPVGIFGFEQLHEVRAARRRPTGLLLVAEPRGSRDRVHPAQPVRPAPDYVLEVPDEDLESIATTRTRTFSSSRS